MNDQKKETAAAICIPTYNERQNIELIIPAVLEKVPSADVLVIDDNSPDGTGDVAEEISSRNKRVHVLHRPGKQGLGPAYIAGFKWALEREFDRIVEFDADFSHDPAYLPELLARLEDADVVVGSRRVPGGGVKDWSMARRLISSCGSIYAKTVLGVRINDLTGGFNGFTAHALKTLGLDSIGSTGYGFQIEIKYRSIQKGLKVVEMPIVFSDRSRGASKMSAKIFLEAMWSVWKLRLGRID
jgi:dolichol-phosphate mannosyltransferase